MWHPITDMGKYNAVFYSDIITYSGLHRDAGFANTN